MDMLQREDWIEAGLRALARSGVAGVRVAATERRRVEYLVEALTGLDVSRSPAPRTAGQRAAFIPFGQATSLHGNAGARPRSPTGRRCRPEIRSRRPRSADW